MMWKIIQINTLNLLCSPATSLRHDGFFQLMDSLDIKVRLVHTIKYQLWYKIQLNMNTELIKFNLSKLLIWFSCSSIPYNFFIDFSNMGSISVKFTYSISEPINSFISVIPIKKGPSSQPLLRFPQLESCYVYGPACALSNHCLRRITCEAIGYWIQWSRKNCH